MASYCPTCASKLLAWPGEPVACQHPGTDALPSRVLAADTPPPGAAELAARRAAERVEGYQPPAEQAELRELLEPCEEQVARALAVEHDLADPTGGQRMIGDALTSLAADLREWYAECAPRAQRRVTPRAAAELAAALAVEHEVGW